MHVVLQLTLTDGRQVIINRFFLKSNLTCEELLEQNDITTTKRYVRECPSMCSPREEEFDSDQRIDLVVCLKVAKRKMDVQMRGCSDAQDFQAMISEVMKANWTELWSTFKTESRRTLLTFYKSIDWSETWIRCAVIVMVLWFVMILVFRLENEGG